MEANFKKEMPAPELKQGQRSATLPKPTTPNVTKNSRPEITCFKCGKKGHLSFNSSRSRKNTSQGYVLCRTPLELERLEFPPCNIKGRIGGKPAEMGVDSGYRRTLIKKGFVNEDCFTGAKITVLTAAGERLITPLAWVEFESEQERHTVLVGVLDKLPVDYLLSRSSFVQTLSNRNILDQWERNIVDRDDGGVDAFVLTRRQTALEDALKRSDEEVDRENSVALRTSSKKETKKNGLIEGERPTLFEDKEPIETVEENTECEPEEESGMENLAFSILDRDRSQFIKDQETDVTLVKAQDRASQKAPHSGRRRLLFFTMVCCYIANSPKKCITVRSMEIVW